MTNNQLTDERIEKIAVWLATESHSLNLEMLTCLRELQERRKAEMDSKPVAEVVSVFGDSESIGERELKLLVGIQNMPYGTKFYRHAQPAPDTEREPIAWLNDAYLARGVVDGEAGSEDAGPGYIPVYREASPAQPAPVVPDEIISELEQVRDWILNTLPVPTPLTIPNARRLTNVINACRAAMLQAANSPVLPEEATPDNIQIIASIRPPHGVAFQLDKADCKLAADIWNACRGAMLQPGNSPVIPDGYVMVPKIPGQAHLNSIAMRYRHDFYLLNYAQKDNALAVARQMYEECSGQGFYTLPAAPQEVK